MKNIVSKTAWPARLLPALPFVIASLFICAALGGWLCSAGCAHTEAGLQRETQLYLVSSNAVDGLKTDRNLLFARPHVLDAARVNCHLTSGCGGLNGGTLLEGVNCGVSKARWRADGPVPAENVTI